MRLCMTGMVALGVVLCGCTGPTGFVLYGVGPNGAYPYEFPRVDMEQAAERTIEGAAIGAALGASVGAMVAINPAVGALIGTEVGAPIGAAVAYATTPPLPDYRPIVVPAGAVIPGFYDRWPPGQHPPPVGSSVPPPPPG
jgi:Glycine zipper